MTLILDCLNEKEKKTRKHWLKFTIFQYFIFPAIIFISEVILLSVLFSRFSHLLTSMQITAIIIVLSGIFSLIFLTVAGLNGLVFWWIYHCAYKKHGTALLLFFLILASLGMSGQLYQLIQLIYSKSSALDSILTDPSIQEHLPLIQPIIKAFFNETIVTFCCSILLNIWWFISAIKLRKVNKKIKTLISPPAPTETLSNSI